MDWRKGLYLEAGIWIAALFSLACMEPSTHTHFTICPLANLGIDWCPGCGLGNSISYALHGNLAASWQSHFLGVPAIFILASRIFNNLLQVITGLAIRMGCNRLPIKSKTHNYE